MNSRKCARRKEERERQDCGLIRAMGIREAIKTLGHFPCVNSGQWEVMGRGMRCYSHPEPLGEGCHGESRRRRGRFALWVTG